MNSPELNVQQHKEEPVDRIRRMHHQAAPQLPPLQAKFSAKACMPYQAFNSQRAGMDESIVIWNYVSSFLCLCS